MVVVTGMDLDYTPNDPCMVIKHGDLWNTNIRGYVLQLNSKYEQNNLI